MGAITLNKRYDRYSIKRIQISFCISPTMHQLILPKKFAGILRRLRVIYFRQPENIGWRGNYQHVRQAADPDYFMWIAADDPLAPTFLSCVMNVYERYPHIVGVMSDTIEIDSFGVEINHIPRQHPLDSPRNWESMRQLFFQNPTTNIFLYHAVFKTHEIQKIELNFRDLVKYASSSEIPVLAQIALKGPIVSYHNLKFYRNTKIRCTFQRRFIRIFLSAIKCF